ncbi:TPA: CRISPR-associated endoribonuclease Cas6 [Clostridioides difficile]|uniref:CRISPR-associated endoribonuclease Cas6 n=1 Tax=Clostridioides TaxID=1870884 RepID=UPI00038CAFBE|nr:CRISPR-associated endoribonuclease Cas6 [Clostridioides difficile]EQF23282.1 CRISPR-associated endoribonuclease Cas6 [Clostridioides difficile CD160]MCC0673697.1 CRISPR-associated endoribonuclease Cas6 [Clostridioides sp. ES-S-0145-01]EGT4052748.1 CRISPR-associated endoribonuclease Cas6 [Clostridioides difficile]EKS7088437.1 CRISPR-associated endoribonuclease Cas6 [Clostridioides difficile]EQK01978.1 CRISPR-associated endoribonuclease Cas6 [Clostridioides difficile P59]
MHLVRRYLILTVDNEVVLDYNYQYELMKRIYEAIESNDRRKALSLHNEGYKIDKKVFKLFNYTMMFEDAKYSKEGIHLNSRTKIRLILSGYDDILNNIIKGFIKCKVFKLYNIEFKLSNMDEDSKIGFNSITLYKVRSPIVASLYDLKSKKQVYLNPMQEEFYKALHDNLMKKYKLIYDKEYTGEVYFDIEDVLSVKKKYVTNIKGKGFVIGYTDFEIFVEADKDMQKVIYYCGLGEKNSIGMGLLTYITSRRA